MDARKYEVTAFWFNLEDPAEGHGEAVIRDGVKGLEAVLDVASGNTRYVLHFNGKDLDDTFVSEPAPTGAAQGVLRADFQVYVAGEARMLHGTWIEAGLRYTWFAKLLPW